MSSGDAKTYLSKRNVPALFECLMTGLMFHRPTDHIQYLIECLEKVKLKGQEELRWNMFIEMQRAKTPLPPITPNNGRRPMSRERSMTPKECTGKPDVDVAKEERPVSRTPTPLPPISDFRTIPDVPIVFLVGGPGCGKSTQADLLIQKHPKWVTISTGELLRNKVKDKGDGEAKWKMVNELMSKGEMIPEDVVETLLVDKMKACPVAEGFIIQGFPRDTEQAMLFDKAVGRLDAVFLLDCEEETLSQQLLERAKDTNRIDNNVNTVAKRIQAYRDKCLPVFKHYDDMEKLFILDGEKSIAEIAEDLAAMFDAVINGKAIPPSPPKEPKPERVQSARSGRTTPKKRKSPEPSAPPAEDDPTPLAAHLMPPEVKVKDEGRKPDMPKGSIIFVAGGPGSGKGTQCKRLVARYTDAVHLSMGDIIRSKISTEGSADEKWGMVTELLRKGDLAPEEVTVELLTNALKEKPDAHFFLVEGFPRNLEQLEDFNKHIGGQSFTVLLDCEESILHYRLSMRGKESERIDDNLAAIGKKLTFFKNTTLPILKTIDDSGNLVVIDGDRDEDEIHFDLCKVLDFAIYGTLPELPAGWKVKGEEPEAEPVVEETIVPTTGTTTGDNIANPHYTAELHASDKTEEQKGDDSKPVEGEGATTQEAPTGDAGKAAASEENKTEDTTVAQPTESQLEKPEAQPDEPEKTTEDSTKAEQPAAENESSKQAEQSEEATKPEEAPKVEAPKTEDAAPVDDSQKEDTPKTEDAAPEGESQKEETPKTEEAAAESEESPKTEEAPKEAEAPKAEESSEEVPAESAPAGEVSQEAKVEESAPATEEEKKEETEEAATTDAAKQNEGEITA